MFFRIIWQVTFAEAEAQWQSFVRAQEVRGDITK